LQDLSMRFNALRFLAMNLKSQNDTLRKWSIQTNIH
jgi:hypothetical protein